MSQPGFKGFSGWSGQRLLAENKTGFHGLMTFTLMYMVKNIQCL
jgi:hypothetical protein